MLANGSLVSAYFIPLLLSLSWALRVIKSIPSPTTGPKLQWNRDVKETKCSVDPLAEPDAKSCRSVGCLSFAGGLVPIHVCGNGRIDAKPVGHPAPETQRRGQPKLAQRREGTEVFQKLHFWLFYILPPKS